MNAWFAKFRISAALDGPKPLSPSLRRRIAASERLGRFAARCAALDRALKQSTPLPAAPPSLHSSILAAVRAHACPPAARPGLAALRWAPAAALGLCLALILAGAWWLQRRPPQPPGPIAQALAAPSAALDLGGQMTHAMPAAVIAPLSNELDCLNRDLDHTAQFLLANLP
jgi:hypothetical protein